MAVFRASKIALLAISKAPNFDFGESMQFSKVEIYQKSKLSSKKANKTATFETSKFTEIDFT